MIWNDSVTRGTLHCGVMCFLISAPVNSVFVRYGNNSDRAGWWCYLLQWLELKMVVMRSGVQNNEIVVGKVVDWMAIFD